ncbi:unnamed protein product [Bemisia tabaci]|uniref:Rab-GAP TBC domain-containing protein n=1 Tax=Bemisia tabaci TaxID=7038 RepID=A0A9P0AAV0_BEMTA|nr:unnamed protein product [Bemisia tabaci]
MDELKIKSIHFTAEKFANEITSIDAYCKFYAELQKTVASKSVTLDDFKKCLLESLSSSGMETDLRNSVFHLMRSIHNSQDVCSYKDKEPLEYLKKAQMLWEKRIHKSLNSMSADINSLSLARFRLASDRDEILEKWKELSTYEIDLTQYRPVYAPKDFLQVLLWLRNPNFRSFNFKINDGTWEFTHLSLKVKSFAELKILYGEISRGEPLIGVHHEMPSQRAPYPSLEAERIALGEKVIAFNHAPAAQEYLKKGAPLCIRARIWTQLLGSTVTPEREEYFNRLKQRVLQYDLVVDKLIIKDVQLTASNDPSYFVFEDLLYQIMLCFYRDTDVLSIFHHICATPIRGVLRGKAPTTKNSVYYPPNGIIPFHGFTMYACPLCYLYKEPVAVYCTFKAFYMRYWFRMHEVSSSEQGILALCLLFARLLQRYEPVLWMHFKTNHIQPVRVVFKWLMRGFSGYLAVEQLLLLWDVILAYDSLEVISILAVAILSFRKDSLFQVNNQQDVEGVLADLSTIRVMPLIQMSLIRETIP